MPRAEEARWRPDLAVLAALAHARSPDALELAERALLATERLDEQHAGLYWDRILDALSQGDGERILACQDATKLDVWIERAVVATRAAELFRES